MREVDDCSGNELDDADDVRCTGDFASFGKEPRAHMVDDVIP